MISKYARGKWVAKKQSPEGPKPSQYIPSKSLRQAFGELDGYNVERYGLYFIYFMLGENEEPLYIGKTQSLTRRIQQHKGTKHWFQEVKNIQYQPIDTGNDYMQANYFERDLINFFRPKYNKQIQKSKRLETPPIESSIWAFGDNQLMWLKGSDENARVYNLEIKGVKSDNLQRV